MLDKQIEYRKSALNRLTAPAGRRHATQLVSLPAWLALIGLIVLLLVLGIWSWFGSLPKIVAGSGVILNPSSLQAVVSETSGRVVAVHVNAGDYVEQGAHIADVSQPDMIPLLAEARQAQQQLEFRYVELAERLGASEDELGAILAARRSTLQEEMQSAKRLSESLQSLAEDREKLMESGVISRLRYLETLSEVAAAEMAVAQAENLLAELEVENQQTAQSNSDELDEIKALLQAAKRQVATLEAQRDQNSIITASTAGQVIEVAVAAGEFVNAGAQILTLQLRDSDIKDLHVLAFPTIADGKRVHEAMTARVVPSTVVREESGYIRGHVAFVADYAATRESMIEVLYSEELVDSLLAEGPPLSIIIDLDIEDNGQRFSWSTQAGDKPLITNGTLADVEIVVEQQRPIELLLPFLRKTTGIY